MRTFALLLLLSAGICACGEDGPPSDRPGANDPEPALGSAPERDVISPEEEADLRQQVLEGLTKPKAVGEIAPSLPALAVNRLMLVVFFRGEWNPPCLRQLGELQDHLKEIEAKGARVVAVSADHRPDLDELVTRLRLSFPLVSDFDAILADQYGVQQKDKILALPSVFVVGPDRKIRFVRVGTHAADHMPIRDILAALGG